MSAATLPPILFSGRVFLGEGPFDGSTRRQAAARFARTGEIEELLDELQERGVGGLMTLGDEGVVRALQRRRQGGDMAFQALPIIPNVAGYVREATEYGLAGAGLRRLARVGLWGFFRASLRGATHPLAMLRKDFPTLLSILYELEMGEMHRFHPPAVFLHHQMTDLALSFNNRRFFEAYNHLMRKRFHTEPALITSQFVRLTQRLRQWKIPIRLIAAPCNPQGWRMPGGLEGYQKALEDGAFRLIADRISPEAPVQTETVEWVLNIPGVEAVVLDGLCPEDVPPFYPYTA